MGINSGFKGLKRMEFESPDVEKDFPGLYASESGKKSNESDCTSAFTVLRMKCCHVLVVV